MLNRILTIGLMADGRSFPTEGMPKEKTEKMHPEIWKRYAIFFAAVAMALAVVIGYFAFATPAPVKTSSDALGKGPPSGDTVNSAVVATATPAENAALNAAVIDWQKKLDADRQNPNYKYKVSIEYLTGKNKALVPASSKEITLDNSLYLTGISIDRINWVVSGNIENKGTDIIGAAGIFFFPVTGDYTPRGSVTIQILNGRDIVNTGYHDMKFETIKPGQKLSFKTHPIENDPQSSQQFLEDQKSAPFLAVEYRE